MKLKSVNEYLEQLSKELRQQVRSRLTKGGNNATKNLYNEIDFFIQESKSKNSISISYTRPKYADYQDRGVSGVKRKFNTPFAYTTKKPPANVFSEWAKQKGFKPRDRKGQFMSYKSFGFAVANNKFNFGIEPKGFFTKSFELIINKIPNEIIERYALDVRSALEIALKE